MIQNRLKEFKKQFFKYKESEGYAYRKAQTSFSKVAKKIIFETLENAILTNGHLTGLIQMFKYNVSNDTFEKYLKANIENQDVHDEILDEAYDIEYTGFTNAGKTAINDLNVTDLTLVKDFLKKAFDVSDGKEGVKLIEDFEKLNIAEVRAGIYSPWLHYVNPKIFPIVNNTHKEFHNWLGLENDYSACIEAYQKLMELTNEPLLSMLDSFGHSFVDIVEAEINEFAKMLNNQYNRIWRCADSYKWDEIKDTGKLTFEWLKSEIDYRADDIEIGSGKRSVLPWVNDLKNGDLIFIMGKNKFHGICIAKSEYSADGPFIEFTHYGKKPAIEVEYLYKLENAALHNIKTHNNPTTFATIDKYNFGLENVLYFLYMHEFEAYQSLIGIIKPDPMNEFSSSNIPLNTILYGPPGTGKTFQTINLALKIINEEEEKKLDWEVREDIKAQFDKRIKEERIVFATFHQSVSYEDFIEGIKPVLMDNLEEQSGKNIEYEITKGIFKQLCERASSKPNLSFLNAYDNFVNTLIKNENELKELYTTKQNKKFFINVNSKNSLNVYTSENNKLQGVMTRENLHKHYNGELVFIGWDGHADAVIEQISSNFPIEKENKADNTKKNFVLIIDEINRGNVSQIFGEIITLLEEDKRNRNDEALEIILPYSKKPFSIPNNVYILGTMNTADRSVEALDVALRRRFSFKEMPPIYSLEDLDYEVAGIKAYSILENINKRVEKLLDQDHMIGHSYFINKRSVNNLENIIEAFYDKIIPLLQEYFYGDYGKIGLVLGKGFVQKKEWKDNDFADFEHESAADFDERDVYSIIDYRGDNKEYSINIDNRTISLNFEKALLLLMNMHVE